jgi:hypothetical protein
MADQSQANSGPDPDIHDLGLGQRMVDSLTLDWGGVLPLHLLLLVGLRFFFAY